MSLLTQRQKAVVDKFMNRWIGEIRSNLDKTTPPEKPSTNTGKSKAGFYYEVKDTKVTLFGPSYVFNLEFGREPGTPPPIEPLKEWARKRGLEEGVAYAVQKTIAKEGTKQSQKGSGSGIISDVITPQQIQLLANELALVTANEIQTLLFSTLKDK